VRSRTASACRATLRAAEATKQGWFRSEIVGLTGEQCLDKKSPGVNNDEGIRADSTLESVGKLRPVFEKDGTVTAANASQISDGAAAVVVASSTRAEELGIKPLAKIVAYHTSGVAPKDIFAAPIAGIEGVLKKANLTVKDVDLFEINEAFAAQVLCNVKALGIPESKLNICGGGSPWATPSGPAVPAC
jgi:acetyl-CoA C-acetyltransferase